MPTYTIQLDDGRKVKVQADSPNAALAEANRFAASNPRKKPNYVIPKRVKVAGVDINLTDAPDAQRLATQGFAFGQSPRIMGAMGAVMGVPDAVRQGKLGPIADAYRQNRQAEIDAIDQARARTGLVGTGIEIAGGMVTGGTIAKAGGQALARVAPKAAPRVAAALAPRAGSVGGKVARFGGRTAVAATGGAVAGGAYGSGEGRGTEGAIYGAVGGAAAEPIARGGVAVWNFGKRLVNRYGAKAIPADQTAARALLEQVEQYGEENVVKEFERLRKAGIRNPTLAEVIPGLARRVGSVARNDMDGARVLARQRAGGMVGDVPILAQQATNNLSRRGGTVQTRQAQMKTRKRAIQNKAMEGIQNQTAEITPAAAGSLRTDNLARPVQAVERNLRTRAQAFSNPALSTEADLLRALREGEQAGGGAIAPKFDPRQTQEFADQMGWADLASQRPPTPNRLPVIEAMKRMGGIKDTYVRDGLSNWRPRQRGEVERVLGRYNDIPGLINNRTGLDLADMAERLREAGYLGIGRVRRDGATAMTEGVQGGTIDDIVNLLENYRQDPDLYRYGLDEKYMDDFVTWADRQSQLDQGGLLGKANEVRARVGQNVYDNAQGPTSDDFLFDGVPSFVDDGTPRQFNLGTVESLRQQISGAERSAGANPDQAQLAETLGIVRRQLVDPVRRQFPEYDRTLKVGEAFNRERDAMNKAMGSGNQAGIAWNYKVPTEDVANALSKMTARELRGYRQGAAESLAGNFNDNRINMSLLEALGGRGLTQERVAAQFPVNRMQELANTANALVNRMETARTINPNFGSQTAGNQATDAMSSVEGFLSLPAGKIGMAQQALKWLARSASGLTPAERVAIVDLSTKPITGDVAEEILRLTQTANERLGGVGLPGVLLGSQLGIQAGNQTNAMARYPEGQ